MLHELRRQPLLVNTLQLGQLHRAVDAGHLRFIIDFAAEHTHAIGYGKLHDVGQVELALRVFIVQPGQPFFQVRCGHSHDAAVNLGDLALRFGGVFLLDDGHHLTLAVTLAVTLPVARLPCTHTGTPHNPPITARVGHGQCQQRQLAAITRCNQLAQGVWLGQRHVA